MYAFVVTVSIVKVHWFTMNTPKVRNMEVEIACTHSEESSEENQRRYLETNQWMEEDLSLD